MTRVTRAQQANDRCIQGLHGALFARAADLSPAGVRYVELAIGALSSRTETRSFVSLGSARSTSTPWRCAYSTRRTADWTVPIRASTQLA